MKYSGRVILFSGRNAEEMYYFSLLLKPAS
jgi:hypothetical protein